MFEQIKAEPKAVLRFTANWCGPCKALAPIFDEVAAANPNAKVFVIDVDIHPDIATKFGVKGIPTMMKTEYGAVVKHAAGALPKVRVEEFFV